MPIHITFPTAPKGNGFIYVTTSSYLNRLCRELDNLFCQLRVQFSFGLSSPILESHFSNHLKQCANITFKVLKVTGGTGGLDFEVKHGAHTVTIEARNVPSGLTGGANCVACGKKKVGQKIISHGAVPASAWSETVCSAMEDLGITISALTAAEKQLTKELMNIGEKAKASSSFPAADPQNVSMCSICENLHSNKSVIQRHRLSLTMPPHERPINLVGPQFGATVLRPEGDLAELERITRNTAKRVITAMEFALREEFPAKFTDPTPTPGGLKFRKPGIRYVSDVGGQYPIASGSTIQTRTTHLEQLLEHLLLNLDLFTLRLSYHAFRICSLPVPATRRKL